MRTQHTVPKTDLNKFKSEVLAKGPFAVLPKNLPDRWLRAFGRDMARAEKAENEGRGDSDGNIIAVPLLSVMLLLTHKKGVPMDQVELYEREIADEYNEYKLAIYSEIIGRQTGIFLQSYGM